MIMRDHAVMTMIMHDHAVMAMTTHDAARLWDCMRMM
jgi:hypothetical protein